MKQIWIQTKYKYEYDKIRKGKYFVNSIITARPRKKRGLWPGSPVLRDHEILIKIFLLFLSNLILYFVSNIYIYNS